MFPYVRNRRHRAHCLQTPRSPQSPFGQSAQAIAGQLARPAAAHRFYYRSDGKRFSVLPDSRSLSSRRCCQGSSRACGSVPIWAKSMPHIFCLVCESRCRFEATACRPVATTRACPAEPEDPRPRSRPWRAWAGRIPAPVCPGFLSELSFPQKPYFGDNLPCQKVLTGARKFFLFNVAGIGTQ